MTVVTPTGHTKECAFHCDQNEWECTCDLGRHRHTQKAQWLADEMLRLLRERKLNDLDPLLFCNRHLIRKALEAFARSPHALAVRVLQAHEWGYRDPVEGGFVEHGLPFELAEAVLGPVEGCAPSPDHNTR